METAQLISTYVHKSTKYLFLNYYELIINWIIKYGSGGKEF